MNKMDCPECGYILELDCKAPWLYEGFCPDCKKEFEISINEMNVKCPEKRL